MLRRFLPELVFRTTDFVRLIQQRLGIAACRKWAASMK
jgi:hypothetical protein